MGKKINERADRVESIYRLVIDRLVDSDELTMNDKAIAGSGMATLWAFSDIVMRGTDKGVTGKSDEEIADDVINALVASISLAKLVGTAGDIMKGKKQ